MTTWIATTKEITFCQCLLSQKKHNVSTYVLKIKNRRLLDTTPKQHGSKSFHGGMTKTIPYFFTTTNDKMQGFPTMAAYLTIFVHFIKVGYLVSR